MRTALSRLVSGFVLWFALPAGALAQEAKDSGSKPPAEKTAEKPSLDGALSAAETALKEKNAENATKALIDLVEVYKSPTTPDADKKRIADVAGKFLKSPEVKVAKAGADALGGMGADGAKALKAGLGDKEMQQKEWKEVRLNVIESLGRTKQANEVKSLLNLLKDKDNDVIAAAAKGLAHFNDAKEGVRKEIAKEIGRASCRERVYVLV